VRLVLDGVCIAVNAGEVVDLLGGRGAVLDMTVGAGGHAEAMLQAGVRRVVGLDRDPAALEHSGQRLARFAPRTHLVHAGYDEMPEVLDRLGLPAVDGMLFDLGVSSMQLDLPERGFAYATDAPLDMRMDPGGDVTAADVVNTYPVPRLARVLREYGEERFALRVAQAFIPEGERFADLRHDRLPIRGAIRSASNATRWAAPVGIPGSATMATPSKASFLSSRPPLNSFRSTLRCGSMKSWKIGAFRHSFHCGRLQDFRVCEPTLCRLTSGGRRSRCIGTGSRRQDA